jgi:hypothetical protein
MWVYRSDALNVLAKAKESTILQEKIHQKQIDIDTLNARIKNLRLLVDNLSVQEEAYKSTMQAYEEQIAELEQIKKLSQLDIVFYKKQMKKYKRKNFWTAVAGVAGTIGGVWLGSQFR